MGDLVTLVGRAVLVTPGEWINAGGGWCNDSTHGQGFRESFIGAGAPFLVEGIKKQLGSSMIRSIGAVYIRKLVRAIASVSAKSFSCRFASGFT